MPHPVDSRTLGLVVAGGAIGVIARAAVVTPMDAGTVAWATLAVNAVGSLLLGVVVGWLDDRRPRLRAFLGTGVLGGFTTYSAFAVQTVGMLETPLLAATLAIASLTAGVIGALVGLFIGRRIADVPGEIEPVEVAE